MLDEELRDQLADWALSADRLPVPDIAILRGRVRRRRLRVSGAIAGLAVVASVTVVVATMPAAKPAAAAPSPRWKMQAPPEPAGTTNQGFGAVSCSSSSACLAVAINDYPRGFGGFAETWNGSRWTVRTVPDGRTADNLEDVNCRSAQWCVAVGTKASGNDFVPVADRWNGSAWTPTMPPAPAGATNSDLGAVACSGTAACTAIGETAKSKRAPTVLAERWNGSSWKIQPVPAPPGGGLLNAVACPAPNACRAVGSDNKGLFSEVWNGSSWVIRPVPVPAGGSSADLWGVSCTAADFCEAVGSYQKGGAFRSLAEVWNGSHWRLQAPSTVPGATSSQLDAVSCVSATDCEAAGDASTTATRQVGVLEKWNGTTWTVQETVLPAGATAARLSGISCTRGPVCEAVGYHRKVVPESHLLALRYSSS
jgi:hypothetical protein